MRVDAKVDRQVALYGFLRGTNLRADTRVHLAGVGDFNLQARMHLNPDIHGCLRVSTRVHYVTEKG